MQHITHAYNREDEINIPIMQESMERDTIGKLLTASKKIQKAILTACLPEFFTNFTYKRMFRIILDYVSKNPNNDINITNIDIFYFAEDNKVIDLKIAGLLVEMGICAEKTICVSNWENSVNYLQTSYEKRVYPECKSRKERIELEKKMDAVKLTKDKVSNIERIENYLTNYDHPDLGVIKTNFVQIDNLTGCFHSGNLIIIAARPAMGKTMVSINFALQMLLQGKKCLFLELEMTGDEIIQRLTAAHLNIPAKDLRNRTLSETDLCKLQNFHISETGKKLYSLLDIPESPKANISQIEMKIRNTDADIIFIDHLTLIRSDSKSSKYETVTDNVERLKTLALEVKKTIVLLDQLNRANTERDNPRPRLSDLRDSGAVEQSADLVMFVHRENYYDPDANPTKLEMIIAKSRSSDGAGHTANLIYASKYQRIIDPEGKTRE